MRGAAVRSLTENAADGEALLSLARHYALRSRCDWAVSMFERAATSDCRGVVSEPVAQFYAVIGSSTRASQAFAALKERDAVPAVYAALWIPLAGRRARRVAVIARGCMA